MCGIFCLIKKEKLNENDKKFCRKKTKELFHRGPDNYGEWFNDKIFIGHQRLSINDLSEKANQPFIRDDKILVFNGEIYNFKDLKKDPRIMKYDFKTSSDTEVLFYLLLEYGINGLKKINGMFAFIFYDGENIIAGNDCFSEKTLFYNLNQDRLFFSSELKILTDLDQKNFDNENLFSYLTFGHLINGNTFYKNTRKLENSEIQIINKNLDVKKTKYFDIQNFYLDNKTYNKIPLIDDFKELEEIISKNIFQKNIGDVNKALLLSGGLDSSTVYSTLSKNKDLNIETITFLNPDENYRDLDQLIKKKNIKNEKIKIDNFELNHSKILNLFGQPHNSFTSLAIKRICNSLKLKNIKVALTGLGGDEIFFGYNKYYDFSKLRFKMKKFLFFGFKNIDLPLLCKSKNFWKFYEDKNYRDWINFNFKRDQKFSDIENMFIDELKLYMPNSRCITNDVASMSESIELRSCFLDQDILKWILKFDLNAIQKMGRKKILKEFYLNVNNGQNTLSNKKSPFRVLPNNSQINDFSNLKYIFNKVFPNIKFDKTVKTRENINALEILNIFKN